MASLFSLARARRTATVLAVAAPVALTLLQFPSSAAPGHTARAGASSTPAHPFSDPVWYPLRQPAWLGCVNGNPGNKQDGSPACDGSSPKHGYPAIDWLSQRPAHGGAGQEDPVYAAGAGVFHVGHEDYKCVTQKVGGNNGEGDGTWVWIDHGGGVVSRYHHLSEINSALSEGDYVTPTTRLGKMGHSGDVCKSAADTVNYVHFEVRTGGVNGNRANIGVGAKSGNVGSLFACQKGAKQVWPHDIGGVYSKDNWNEVTWHVTPFTPVADDGCIPADPNTATKPANFSSKSSSGKVTLKWAAPSAAANVDSITVGERIFRPSQNGYSQEAWHTGIAGTATSVTFTKSLDGKSLVNGRDYRYRVTFHNNDGNSAWSKWLTVTPGAVPNKPSGVRTASIGRDYIGFGWYWTSKDANGMPMKRFDLAVRKHTSAGTATWTTFKGSASVHYYKFANLKPHTSYDVRVRGVNSVGPGPWLTRTYKTKS